MKVVELSIYFTGFDKKLKKVLFAVFTISSIKELTLWQTDKCLNNTQNLGIVSILSVQLFSIGKKQNSLTKLLKSRFFWGSVNINKNYPWQTDNYLRALQNIVNTLLECGRVKSLSIISEVYTSWILVKIPNQLDKNW